jgi:hypothetical protein
MLTVGLGTMLAPPDSSLTRVALPKVMDEFKIGLRSAGWPVTAHAAASSGIVRVADTRIHASGDRFGNPPR